MTERLMTREELADYLRVKPSTIRRWRASGRIPEIVLSHKAVRYDVDAVLEALTSVEPPIKRVGNQEKRPIRTKMPVVLSESVGDAVAPWGEKT